MTLTHIEFQIHSNFFLMTKNKIKMYGISKGRPRETVPNILFKVVAYMSRKIGFLERGETVGREEREGKRGREWREKGEGR